MPSTPTGASRNGTASSAPSTVLAYDGLLTSVSIRGPLKLVQVGRQIRRDGAEPATVDLVLVGLQGLVHAAPPWRSAEQVGVGGDDLVPQRPELEPAGQMMPDLL